MRVLAPALVLLILSPDLWGQASPGHDFEKLPFAPRQAICYRAAAPLTIDGRLEEPAWRRTAWSEPFIDIMGDRRPHLSTRVKMLWDDEHFYVAAELEEPDVWATLTARDSVIFQDNDFEVFIDPDGDTHGCRQRRFHAAHDRYATDLSELDAAGIQVEGLELRPSMRLTDSWYEIRAAGFDNAVVHLRQDGKVWVRLPGRGAGRSPGASCILA